MDWSNCGGTTGSVDGVATIGGVVCLLKNLLGVIPGLLILVAVGMIIFSGARMIMSADNPKEVESAQKTLTYAVVGVVGIGLAWLLLVLIQQFTGAKVTEINFGQ